MAVDERFCFMGEWYDPQASMTRTYQVLFYPADSSIEMYDVKTRRAFLKRTKCETIKFNDFFIGNTINIFSRSIKIADFGDAFTARSIGKNQERTLAIIKPDAIRSLGDIISAVYENGFTIARMRMVKLSQNEVMYFYSEHKTKEFFPRLCEFMTSGPVVAMELVGSDAVNRWRSMIGPTDTQRAREQGAHLLRARFGTDGTKNALHGSDSAESVQRELSFFFGSKYGVNTACYNDTTCCVIKPHAVAEGRAGHIINAILIAGFQVSAIGTYSLDKVNAEEFLEVYKGVVHEYPKMVEELMSGACIVLEVRAQNAQAVFRDFCGPADPEIARHIRPRTLRALYGKDKVKNAVHCTDLAEDASLEVEYFFRILDH
ncbi:unnamed protein product [Adineta steineri]|uniref:DM10 domain-containing protein n=1 Tax=Adineta steineri TaxID=433720 RepID=A0A815U6F7_9BILA|nr:unnamed protein product [Adineta steineri]CAF1518104.1 unnamed protein product [Adineta steineri]CAF1649291.1 unnamed protein product [Adineta steineri]CAF1649320.1 unnamed protein product [Adineta steineri]